MGWARVPTPGLTDGDGLGEEGAGFLSAELGTKAQEAEGTRAFQAGRSRLGHKRYSVLPFCHCLMEPKGRPWGVPRQLPLCFRNCTSFWGPITLSKAA